MELYTAFIIGLVGSLHCIGMCGPIALMLPVNSENKASFFLGRFLYNAGRILTYSLMGLIIGYIGNKISLYGYQQSLSIILGIIILLVVVLPKKYLVQIGKLTSYYQFLAYIKNSIGKLFKTKSSASLFIIGLLNGFLPCGLVYLALGTAAASGSPLSGVAVMFLFGVGTLPVMFAVSSFFKYFPLNFRNKAAKLIPYFALALAVIFILRGLNLGIPYISPKMNKADHSSADCH